MKAKLAIAFFIAAAFLAVCIAPATAQQSQETEAAPPPQSQPAPPPLRQTLAITYPEGQKIDVKLQGTSVLPHARGVAQVHRRQGVTRISMRLDGMRPAEDLGGDFATYVVWVASPDGSVNNAGELVLHGDKSALDISTPYDTFAMFVTAEPYFLIQSPSRIVIVDNMRPEEKIRGQLIQVAEAQYRGSQNDYGYSGSLIKSPTSDEAVRSEVKQARVAVNLAKQAGAEQYAPGELSKAEGSLQQTLAAAQIRPRENVTEIAPLAHQTVRLAVAAQRAAEDRARQATLNSERQQYAAQISQLKNEAANARSDAERAQFEAEEQAVELNAAQQAELAQQNADAQEKQAEQAQLDAQAEAQRDRNEAQTANQPADQARAEAEQAKQQREAERGRMQQALNGVIQTRMTGRGLVMSLPDVLFENGQSALKPQTREMLSKVCGVLQGSGGGYTLSIEGYTDNTGSDAYNQKLSENRALAVKEYLSNCGIRGDNMIVQGFAKSQPIAPNNTAAGRQENRRVEIVVQDSAEYGLGDLP